MKSLLSILLNEILLPELLRFIKDWAATHNGEFPSEADIKAELSHVTASIVRVGDAWNLLHPED